MTHLSVRAFLSEKKENQSIIPAINESNTIKHPS